MSRMESQGSTMNRSLFEHVHLNKASFHIIAKDRNELQENSRSA